MKLFPLTALSIVLLGASLAEASAPRVVGTWSVTPSPVALATADGRVEVPRTEDFVTDGPMAYLATRTRGADLRAVDLDLPFVFPDADSDGVWRLGCLGDSNTEPSIFMTRWCEKLALLIDDPRFEIVNFSVSGATAIPTGNDASTQVDAALDPDRHLEPGRERGR